MLLSFLACCFNFWTASKDACCSSGMYCCYDFCWRGHGNSSLSYCFLIWSIFGGWISSWCCDFYCSYYYYYSALFYSDSKIEINATNKNGIIIIIIIIIIIYFIIIIQLFNNCCEYSDNKQQTCTSAFDTWGNIIITHFFSDRH